MIYSSKVEIKDERKKPLTPQEFEKLAKIRKNDVVRVYPNGEFHMMLFGRWQCVQKCGHYPFWTREWFDRHYKDAHHKGVQGRGYVQWCNGDFAEPFTVDIIVNNMQ